MSENIGVLGNPYKHSRPLQSGDGDLRIPKMMRFAENALHVEPRRVYSVGRMQSNGEHTRSNGDETQRYSVQEAAKVLGITPEAVRSRLARGTLEREKTSDGGVYVRLNADQAQSNGDESDDRTAYNDLQVEGLLGQLVLLKDQVQFLRRELERKDTILLNMSQGLKSLEAPREPRESSVTLSGDGEDTHVSPEDDRRSWWRRLLEM